MQHDGQLQASQALVKKKEVWQQPRGHPSEENVVAPKRRSFFTKNYKVNPFWTSPAEPTAKATVAPAASGQPCWSDLPEGVLELILTAAKGQSLAAPQNSRFSSQGEGGWDKTPIHASCVCRAWHRAVRRVYFSDWWQGPTHIKHPHQLFSLSPWSPLGLAQGLVRCHMRREYTRDGMRFTLFLGDDSAEATCYKFLMVALVSRWDTTLYLNQACTSPPCATIAANVFGTHYGLVMHPSVQPFTAMDRKYDAAGGAKPAGPKHAFQLADVEYLTRLRSFMRPRRMRVHLPGPDALLPYRSDDLCWRSSKQLADLALARAASLEQSGEDLPRQRSSIYSSSTSLDAVPVAYGEEDAEAEETSRACASLDGAVLDGESGAGPSSATELRPGTLLRNKQPHWNEKLRCWCLNFKGRVKLASVKNFQLVDAADPSKALVMQFGKSEANTYILDYQSNVISAVQAFAIALSAFDTKLLL